MMTFDEIFSFENLYAAHRAARRGKRNTTEVIRFEMNLAQNLTTLVDALHQETYVMGGYYHFMIQDPKVRKIHALHYVDRVVQHCLCDQLLASELDKRLVYDNAACRFGKGTHFAVNRVTGFLRQHYKQHGNQGYFLKCDIRKFFDSIDHEILKQKLSQIFTEEKLLRLLFLIIDSFEVTSGKGLPMGNQTSQWFAILYLDRFDRLIKEQLHIRYYSRYMDDCVLIHHDKMYLQSCLTQMQTLVENEKLSFNQKTQIIPLKNGVQYLGWHLYLTSTGKIVKQVTNVTKTRFKHRLKSMQAGYAKGAMEVKEISMVLMSYHAHFAHGHTWQMQKRARARFVLVKHNQQDNR